MVRRLGHNQMVAGDKNKRLANSMIESIAGELRRGS
jgi:hypothetical protein